MTYDSINQTDLPGMFKYANSVSGDAFGVGIALSLYFIIFFYLKSRAESTPESMAVAGFITTIVSVFLRLLGLVSNKALFICIVMTVIPVIWGYFHNE